MERSPARLAVLPCYYLICTRTVSPPDRDPHTPPAPEGSGGEPHKFRANAQHLPPDAAHGHLPAVKHGARSTAFSTRPSGCAHSGFPLAGPQATSDRWTPPPSTSPRSWSSRYCCCPLRQKPADAARRSCLSYSRSLLCISLHTALAAPHLSDPHRPTLGSVRENGAHFVRGDGQ